MSNAMDINNETMQSMSIAHISTMKSAILSSCFSRDGENIAISTLDNSLYIYNTNDVEERKLLYCKKQGIGSIMYTHHPSALLHTSRNSYDDSIMYLSVHDNKYLRYFRGHTDRVISMDLSPVDDTFLSGSLDDTIRLWDLRTPECQGILRYNLPKSNPHVAYDPLGLIFASTATPSIVKLFDLRQLGNGPFSTFKIDEIPHTFTSLKFDETGKHLLLTTNQSLTFIIDSFNGKREYTITDIKNDEKSILGSCFTPNSKFLLLGSENGSIIVWDLENDEKYHEWENIHPGPVGTISFCPNKMLFVSTCTNVAFWLPDPSKIIKEEGEL